MDFVKSMMEGTRKHISYETKDKVTHRFEIINITDTIGLYRKDAYI